MLYRLNPQPCDDEKIPKNKNTFKAQFIYFDFYLYWNQSNSRQWSHTALEGLNITIIKKERERETAPILALPLKTSIEKIHLSVS
jgi:hypothetical protein